MTKIGKGDPGGTRALKRRAVEVARYGSEIDGAAMMLWISRRLRRELRGQAPGIPDLSLYRGRIAEGALAYEYLPELVSRIYSRHGLEILRTADEQDIPSLSHFSDMELRFSIGENFRQSRFPAIASKLRSAGYERSIASEILSNGLVGGNVIEIMTSRIIPALVPEHPDFRRDLLEIDRIREVRKIEYGKVHADPIAEAEPSPGP